MSIFTTERFPPGEQFEAWRADHVAMFAVEGLDGVPSPYGARATTYHLGRVMIGEASYGAFRYWRDEQKVREGLEMILVRLYLRGGHVGTNGRAPVEARAGDVDVIDFTQPMAYESVDSALIVLGIPKPALEKALPNAGTLHGFTLSGTRALGALLGDYLRSLMARLPEITVAEADGVSAAAIAMVAACLRPSLEDPREARIAGGTTLLARAKNHIEQNLGSAGLTTDALCATFGLSRASLYRLFEPDGGVKRYIRDRRLVGAFVALADPEQRGRTIGEIAFEVGFVSEPHFSRVFRRAFGCTPGEARDIERVARLANVVRESSEPAYIDWMRRLAARDR